MTHGSTGLGRTIVLGLLFVAATIAAGLTYRSIATSSSRDAFAGENVPGEESTDTVPDGQHRAGPTPPGPPPRARRSGGERDAPAAPRARGDALAPPIAPPGGPPASHERGGAVASADGGVPAGTTIFDIDIPGVGNLDPALLDALREAAADAADDGIEFFVNSGWRSPEYQEQLLREAVTKYGSPDEAARWVATPGTSAHVSGDAVDLGFAATAWLSRHGAEYGLCQIYRNELWHYELRSEARDRGCPPMYADPTQDPRMQQ